MPQKSSSSKRGTTRPSTAAGHYKADVASTPSRCLRTPCELQPDGFLQNNDNRSSVHGRAEQQLTLRIDRIKQRLLECQSESVSQTGSRRSPERSARQCSSQHHFCVDHKGAESIPDNQCSQSGDQRRSSSHTSPADQAYEAYKMSAVNKLVKELAHKQQECRKAKIHAVALQEELAWARLTGKPRPAGFPRNTSCSRAALALDALAASLEAEQKGSPAYKALQQSLCEEAHRRLQAVEQLQEVRQQLDSSDKQAKCWEHAAESGAAKIAELQDDVAREQRQQRAAEAKLEVAKEVSHENGRLQEKLHSYRTEVRQLESSCHAHSQEAQVLQAQLRELEGILSDRHEDITNLHDQLATSHSRVAELELMRGRELGDYDKLEKLEVCTENLVKRLQLDHDKMAAEKSELMREGSTLKSKLVAEKQHAAVLQAQLRVVKEESKETEGRATTALDGIAAAGTSMLKLKGREARSGTSAQASPAASTASGCAFVWRLLTTLDDAFEGKLTKRPYTEGAGIAAKHAQQLSGSGSAVSSAMPESTSTEPSSGPLAAADTLDRDPAHYDLSGAVIESSSTLREAVRRLQAAEHNMPSYTRFISGTKGSASAPQCEKKPHSGRASPGTSTVKPQAATRLHKPNRSPDSARALASGNSQEAGRKQDAVKAQTQAIFSAQAAVKAMDALKAQHTGSLRGTDTPQDKSPLQAKPKPQPGTGSKDRSLSPNTGKAQASMPEPAPEPQDASDIQGAGALEGSGTESSLGKPQESIRPQLLNGWRLLPGQQPPLAALPDDIAAWDTPRLEQMPGRLPEPRFNSHLLHSASKAAVPALKAEAASSAYDSPRVAQSKGGEGGVVEESADGKWPAHVLVQCNGNQGKFLLNKQSMVCTCKLCQTKAAKLGLTFVDMTPTEFERHSGMAASKKWKYTVRIQHDGRPIGTWLEIHGYAPKALTRDRSLPADCKVATRERNRTRDRSKSSDISGEASLAATAAAARDRPTSTGPHRLASGHLHAAPPASTAAAPPAPTQTSSPPAKRDRQGQAAAKADEEQVPQGRGELHGAGGGAKQDEAPAVSGPDTKRARRKAIARPQLRESSAHQATIPDQIGSAPAPLELPLRWEPGPSFAEALASARGPEKAAADLLPLDATFDPETHEGAALSTHAGRNQRSLPDKRARRKPGWLDNTVDPKQAAQLALHQAAPDMEGQSDGEGNDSGGANGTWSNPDLRWSSQRRTRPPAPARKRDRDPEAEDTDMVEDSEWRGPGRAGKRNRQQNRYPDQQLWTTSAALLHSDSNVPQRLRTLPRGTNSNVSNVNAKAELDAVATLGSMSPQILEWQPVGDNYLQVCVKFRGRTFNGVINAVPEGAAPGGRQGPRHTGSGYMDTAAGESETFSPKIRRGNRSPRKHGSGHDDFDSATHSPMAAPPGHERGPHGPSRLGSRRFQPAQATSPEQPDTYSGAQVTPPARGHHEDGEVQSSSRRQANSAEPAVSAEAVATTERRATVDRECARLEAEGAPVGTRCAFCHGTEVDDEDGGGRQKQGLGQFTLVRVSAIQYAWVHSQCAWWSPEVYESEGVLEGVPDAVRRGRKLKCKECASKGATLGCHVRNCRSSFHLPCARLNHCVLQDEPYLVTCPQHAASYVDRSQPGGTDAPRNPEQGYNRGSDMGDYEDQEMPNGDVPRHRALDRSGSHMQRSLTMEDRQGSHQQQQGRPLERWEEDDEAEGGEGMLTSSVMKDWIRSLPDRNFDPDAVPDEAMANFLGGTVSIPANRPGRCAVCTIQRKGKCGSLSAPSKCRRKKVLAVRRQIQEEEEEPWLPQPAQRRKRT
ncbi:hypothetical protein WJX82_008757 [Trebouxia sp. C0006]